MNAFLVIFRNYFDDFPVSIHASREGAMVRLKEIIDSPDAWLKRMNKVVDADASTPVSVAIAEYQDGELIKFDVESIFK